MLWQHQETIIPFIFISTDTTVGSSYMTFCPRCLKTLPSSISHVSHGLLTAACQSCIRMYLWCGVKNRMVCSCCHILPLCNMHSRSQVFQQNPSLRCQNLMGIHRKESIENNFKESWDIFSLVSQELSHLHNYSSEDGQGKMHSPEMTEFCRKSIIKDLKLPMQSFLMLSTSSRMWPSNISYGP